MKCIILKSAWLVAMVIATSSCDNSKNVETSTDIGKTDEVTINSSRDMGTNSNDGSTENSKPEGDDEKSAEPNTNGIDENKSGLHPGGDIIILKNTNASYAEVFVNLLQLGRKRKIISENISSNSDCRSFGFPVLYYTSLMTPSSDADVYYFRKQDPESDDSTCQLIDYSVSADNKKGGVGIMIY